MPESRTTTSRFCLFFSNSSSLYFFTTSETQTTICLSDLPNIPYSNTPFLLSAITRASYSPCILTKSSKGHVVPTGSEAMVYFKLFKSFLSTLLIFFIAGCLLVFTIVSSHLFKIVSGYLIDAFKETIHLKDTHIHIIHVN